MTHQSRMTSKVHRNALSPAQPASCLARSSPRLSSPRHTAPLPSGLVNGAGTTGGQAARPSHACVAIRSFMHAAGLPSPTLRGTCHTVHLVEVGRLIACPALPAQFVQTAHASRFGLVAPTIQSVEEVTDLIYVPICVVVHAAVGPRAPGPALASRPVEWSGVACGAGYPIEVRSKVEVSAWHSLQAAVANRFRLVARVAYLVSGSIEL